MSASWFSQNCLQKQCYRQVSLGNSETTFMKCIVTGDEIDMQISQQSLEWRTKFLILLWLKNKYSYNNHCTEEFYVHIWFTNRNFYFFLMTNNDFYPIKKEYWCNEKFIQNNCIKILIKSLTTISSKVINTGNVSMKTLDKVWAGFHKWTLSTQVKIF